MHRLLAALLLAAPPLALANTIYKCTDAGGGILISNAKVDKSCKAIVSGPDSSVPPPPPKARAAAASPSPAGFPKVAEETQKARDGDRRRILEQELAAEQKSLETARKDLSEQESLAARGGRPAPEHLTPYKERVGQHERNLQAINRELANFR